MKKIIMLACKGINNELGINNKLPWKCIKDMNNLKKKILKKRVILIMGNNTFKSIPLSTINKIKGNILILSNKNNISDKNNIKYFKDLYSIQNHLNGINKIKKVYILGGESVYKQILNSDIINCNKLILTTLNITTKADTYFPSIPLNYKLNKIITEETNVKILNNNNDIKTYMTIEYYNKTNNTNEYQYLNLISKVLNSKTRNTRNGNTKTIFSPETLIFDISSSFPLLTTKKMPWNTIVRELLFFLSGETNTKILESMGVNIWKGNTSKEFINSRNLDYEEGYMGPMYGYQLNYFGSEYPKKEGFNQIKYIIDTLINDRYSRRLLMTTFNPWDVSKSVLMPCHGIAIQFFVRDNKYLDCKMYQRSGDLILGVPFNIASYALLLELIVTMVNNESTEKLKAGHLYIDIGDCHIYEEHIEQTLKQLLNKPYDFPTINIKPFKYDDLKDLLKIKNNKYILEDNIILNNYKYYPKLKFVMKV